jgi:SAM-dependent methyltransferase
MKIFVLVLFFLFYGTFDCISQVKQSDLDAKIIEILTNYRNEVFVDKDKLQKFTILQEKWTKNGASAYRQERFISEIFWYNIKIKGLSYKKCIKEAQKSNDYANILKNFSLSDFVVMLENEKLIEYIADDIIKVKYPHELLNVKDTQDEIAFYELRDSLKIGEIGAGTGSFSIILDQIYTGMTFYINEKSAGFVQYIADRVEVLNADSLPTNKLVSVAGTKKSINLENKNLDKIIIRDAFHHFSKPKKMLQSIKKSLKPDGALYLYEFVPKKDKIDTRCKKIMETDKIKFILLDNGFKLVEEKVLERDRVLLKFVVG